jgi:adenine phosphoribosyltransferase
VTARERLLAGVREIPDFPTPGVLFRDITPLLQDAEMLRIACEALAEPFKGENVTGVVGIESRGFIFGPPVALALGAGFSIARKSGKLPWKTERETYELEYGTDSIEMHSDSVRPGSNVLLIDDLIATGGTAGATAALVERMGGKVVGCSFLIELSSLEGRKRLSGFPVRSVLVY